MSRADAVVDAVINEIAARMASSEREIGQYRAQVASSQQRAEMLENQCSDLRTALWITRRALEYILAREPDDVGTVVIAQEALAHEAVRRVS